MFFPLAATALALEALIGYPDALFPLIRHPVVWIGALITQLDRHLNRAATRAHGVLALILLLAAVALVAIPLQTLPLPRIPALLIQAVLASTLLAQRSLWRHVHAVALALDDSLPAARVAVSHIVGRNPATLNEAAVARAAIESLAENFSDGVVAPAVWCALAGLPGIALYKAINTADSMIGHLTPRHRAFGWAAARLDDLVNLPASRLAALWIVLAALCHRADAGADAGAAWRAIWRDAGHHRSPNAGWPEAAMAGALHLRLAGPRIYGDTSVDDAWMGDGTPEATTADLHRALTLYRTACLIQWAATTALAFATG